MTTAGNATAGQANIYQFIKSKGGIKQADTNNDGKVSDKELKAFLEGQDFSAEEIAAFWKDVDTKRTGSSRNCLDENEMKVVLCKSEAADQINTYAEELAEKYFSQIESALTDIEIDEEHWVDMFKNAFNNGAILDGSTKIDPTSSDFVDKMEEYVRGEMDKAVNTALILATANTVRDAVIENTSTNDTLKTLSEEYGYDISKDSVLTAKIESIIKGLSSSIIGKDGEINADAVAEIQSKIEAAVGSYLKLAGIGNYELTGNKDEVSQGKKLNDLQLAVLKMEMKDEIEEKAKAFEETYGNNITGAKDIYLKAMEAYIEKALASANPTTYFKNGVLQKDAVTELINGAESSNEFKEIVCKTKVYDLFTLKEGETTNALLDKFKEAFGNTELYTYISEHLSELLTNKSLQSIIDGIVKGLNPDKFDIDDVIDQIVKAITKDFAKIFPAQAKKMTVDNVASMYESRINGDDTEDAKAALKEFIEFYYNKTTGDYKSVVDDFFSTNYDGQTYKNALDSMFSSDIRTAFTELRELFKEVFDISTLSADDNIWNDFAEKADQVTETNQSTRAAKNDDKTYSFTLTEGQVITGISIRPDIDNLDTEKYPITYESTNSKYITIDKDGDVTITGAKAPVSTQVTVTIKVGGKEYAKKVININIKEMEGTKLKKEDEIGMRNDDAQIISLQDLLSGTTQGSVTLMDWTSESYLNLQSGKTRATEKLANIVTQLGDDLKTRAKGQYPDSVIDNAVKTTISYYSAAINAVRDINWNDGDNGSHSSRFTYTVYDDQHPEGYEKTCDDTYYQNTRKYCSQAADDNKKYAATKGSGASATGTGLLLSEAYNKNNEYKIDINLNVLASNFMKFMV